MQTNLSPPKLLKGLLALYSNFQKSQVQITSAGMPPAYHSVSSSGKVKEVLQVGLPLGSIQGEHYLQEEYPFD